MRANVTVTTFIGIILWYGAKYFMYAVLNKHKQIYSVLRKLPKINVFALISALATAAVIAHSPNCTRSIDTSALACLVVTAASLLVAGLDVQRADTGAQPDARHPYIVACMASFIFVVGAAAQSFPSDSCSSVALIAGSTVTAGLFLVAQYNSYLQQKAEATETSHDTGRTSPRP
jgi:hypothetical protein